MNVGGALTLNGTETLNINALSGFTFGNYKLLGYSTTTGAGSIMVGSNNSTLAAGTQYNIINTGTEYDLQVLATGAKNDTWTGSPNANWDTATANFVVTGTTTPAVAYADGDTVTFDDTAANDAAHRNITVQAAGVTPFSTTVNSTGPYTFSGGPINGGPLVKSGIGTLTLNQTANGFSAATLNAGVVNVAGFGSLGSTATSAISLGTATSGVTLAFNAGGTQTTTRGLTLLARRAWTPAARPPPPWP